MTTKQHLRIWTRHVWTFVLLTFLSIAVPASSQTIDSFNPGASTQVRSLTEQSDGKILAGGSFTQLAGQTRARIGRLNPEGTLDTNFNIPITSDITAISCNLDTIAIQPDRKILVGGDFKVINGQLRNYLGRINYDGTLDSAFNPGANSYVYALTVQTDGKILVGGHFTELGGQTRNRIGRLHADGTLDATFNPDSNGIIYSLAIQPNAKIVVGGGFTALAGQSRNRFGRLNADGTLDTTFNPRANGLVYAIAVQADGMILVGGNFTALGGETRNYIGRINADGTLDSTFNPNSNGAIYSFTVQANGKILVGGSFSMMGGQARNCIARLNADGTLDDTFNPGANSAVFSLTLDVAGNTLVGGAFSMLGGSSRKCIGRLSATEPATQNLAYDTSTIRWQRGGTSPEVWRTTFETSTNGLNWSYVGAGVRVPGGWALTNVTIPTLSTIRARGYAAGGWRNSSSWFVETISTPPDILINNSSFGFLSNQFGFNVNGNTGQIFILEGSTNLSNWMPLATNTLASEPLYFADPNSTNFSHRFYRTRVP